MAPTALDVQQLRELGQQLRADSVRASASANSGHPTSSMSAADLMAVLLARHLRFDFDDPRDPHNDRVVFSKGHATPLLYSMYKAAGVLFDDELMTYRSFSNRRLQGHPTPALEWVDVATGSLGQGLPIAVGLALAGQRLDRLPYRTWVLCGDSEMSEGSMWEAVEHAAFLGLDNLTAIVDVNRLGQRGETMYQWNLAKYAEPMRAFGWHVIEVDGHDVEAIDEAYAEARSMRGRPTVILARTVKGKGVARVEDKNGFHGKPLDDPDAAIEELGGVRSIVVPVAKPDKGRRPHRFTPEATALPAYERGSAVPTRNAFGEALVALGSQRGDVVVLDGEIADSTRAEFFQQAFSERFFEMYIAEQQMIAAAVGMQVLGWLPFCATFGAFMSRAMDFIRMASIGEARLCLVGSHAGVAVGKDGPSQMGLEDIAAFRALHASTVLYPCDANQTAKLVQQMADWSGIVYLRTTRGATPVIYGEEDEFHIGGSRVLRASAHDDVTIVGAGVTVHEALRAADELERGGLHARVIDLYSIKPLDKRTLRDAVVATKGRVVTVEDHRPEGGLGEAVLQALTEMDVVAHPALLAVRKLPVSGEAEELLADQAIDAKHVAERARQLVAHRPYPKRDLLTAAYRPQEHWGGR